MAVFSDIIGQEQIKKHLMGVLASGKVSHAYLLSGERSCGKEFIANIFAAALQCEREGTDPCGECHSCKQVETGNQPDIIHVTHEKPGSIGVDDIRRQINDDIIIKPYSSKYKIYIMNEAEKMTIQAQNALLKTLEEPPAYAVIILLSTNVEAMLQTVLSRCVVLGMKPVPDEILKSYLMKEMQIPDYKADVCVAFARGNVGKARILAKNEKFDRIREDAVSLLKYIRDMEIHDVVKAVKKINEYKLEVGDYLDIMAIWYRDALLFKATNDANHLIFKEEIQYIKRVADQSTYDGIDKILLALGQTKRRIEANVNFDLAIELLLLTIQENS